MEGKAEKRFPAGSGPAPESLDRDTIQKLKEFFLLFANTISAMRIFSSHHENVLKFRAELFGRLFQFLGEGRELEISIAENAFYHQDEPVFQEKNVAKGLPYLFFKDGMQKLAFVSGLGRDEFDDFLEVVRRVALLPATESDIVDALWRRDFEHIHYYCPDEFLEGKLAGGRSRVHEFKVDRSQFARGRIDLDEDDRLAIGRRLQNLGRRDDRSAATWAEIVGALDQRDAKLLAAMLTSDRLQSAEDEFIELIFEVLCLENETPRFLDLLGLLEAHHKYLIQGHDFDHAVRFFDMMADLRRVLFRVSPERAESLGAFFRNLVGEASLAEVKTAAQPGRVRDPQACYEYLKRLGPKAIAVGAEIIEENDDPSWRQAGLRYLAAMAKSHFEEIIALAREDRPALAKAIIAVLGEREDKRSILQLAAFRNYKDVGLRRKTVRVLSEIDGDPAPRILAEFLRDADESIRIEAAKAVRPFEEPTALARLLDAAGEKTFRRKKFAEKEAILGGLARSGDARALALLRTLLFDAGFFGRAQKEETRLAAASALASARTPGAESLLAEGARAPRKAVAAACQKALQRTGRRTQAGEASS